MSESLGEAPAGREEKGSRILILEQDPAAAESLIEFLRSQGYEPKLVTRLEDVADAARERRPVAVVFDERLREWGGWAQLDAHLEQPILREIPVIQASFRASDAAPAAQALEISKPVRSEQLQSALRQVQQVLGRFPSKVLVVDDEPEVCQTIARYLGNAGYKIEMACNGLDALCRAFSFRPDVVITDLRMPEMDGFDLIERLHVYPATMRTPVFVLTGSALTDEERARLRPKVHAIFSKGRLAFERLLWHLRWVERLHAPAHVPPAAAGGRA